MVFTLFFYIWGHLFVWRTDDTKILHKYQGFIIWGPLASKKLEAIYSKQLDECTTAEKAMEIRNLVQHLPSGLHDRAYQKWGRLAMEEMGTEIENARGDEKKLLEPLKEIAFHHAHPVRELEGSVMEALRPFTEKRIREATTLRELVELKGAEKWNLSFFDFGEVISRIDSSLEGLYSQRLKQLVLKESIEVNTAEGSKKLCFITRTGDSIIDALVSAKKGLLSGPCSERVLSDVNLELRLFQE